MIEAFVCRFILMVLIVKHPCQWFYDHVLADISTGKSPLMDWWLSSPLKGVPYLLRYCSRWFKCFYFHWAPLSCLWYSPWKGSNVVPFAFEKTRFLVALGMQVPRRLRLLRGREKGFCSCPGHAGPKRWDNKILYLSCAYRTKEVG